MKKLIALAAGTALALTLAGCGSPAEETPAATEEESTATVEELDAEAQAGNELAEQLAGDTGAGEMYIETAAGTSQDGAVPQVTADADTQVVQIGVVYEGGNGTEIELYVDGEQVDTMAAAEAAEATLDLTGDMLEEGEHMVEAVAMEGDEILIHKTARYEVVASH